MIIGQQVFQRSYIAPPGVTPEALSVLRASFDATMKNAEYKADADKMRIDISPLPGQAVQDIVTKLHATPKDIVEKARAAIRP
jgi:tripartite-type tricarboxylate transporter receptor subunit TctC